MSKIPKYIGFEIKVNGLEVDILQIDDTDIEKAMECRIPKTPIVKIDGLKRYMCPNCAIELMRLDGHNVQHGHMSKYCEYCGQAIEWGVNNE